MCNLYAMTAPRQAVLRLFRVGDNRAMSFEGKPAYFPGHAAPVIRRAPDGAHELVTMSWGFVLPQAGKAPRRVTNARDDKIETSFWKPSFESRRCLVPVTSFAEPRDVTPCTWHWFALKGDEPRPLFAFAGLWRRWIGPIRKGGESVDIETFSFLTTEPNTLVGAINHERMPVLLADETARNTWLAGPPAEAFALARPYPPDRMVEVQAGYDKIDLLGAAPVQPGLLL